MNETLFVPLSDTSLCCHVFGSGDKDIVMVHGNGEDYTVFQQIIPDLVKDYRIIAIDSRGHGLSPFGRKRLTYNRMAEDTFYAIKMLRLNKPHFIGFSDGGIIGLILAVNYPHLIDRYVICGANLNPMGLKNKVLATLNKDYLKYLSKGVFSDEDYKNARHYRLMVQEPMILPKSLGKIQDPVLILAGDRDIVKESHTNLIARSIPNSHIHIVEDCGHFVFNKKPEEALKVIHKFFSEKR
ncbi:MAG: alpha/beta hydrolase [Firmicutes bacterium]|nr:alpha/beta hydrolase [Bacillota bacterium]